MQTIRLQIDSDDGIAVLVHDAPGAAVNTMTRQWQADLAEAVAQLAAARGRLRGVIVESGKPTFFAGAQLDAVLTLTPADAPAAFAEIEAMKRSFRTLETLGCPVVALVHGAALGGGWEVALAAHARFAVDDRKIQLGTPEVTLGLIPGACGITKTVRLLGLQAAQPYLLEGKLFSPAEAYELGLVDGLGSTLDELRQLARAWIAAHPDAVQPWDRKDYKMPGGTPASPKIAGMLAVAPAVLAQKTRGLYPAAQAILETMVEGALVDFDTATRIESRKLAQVMTGQVAKNMIGAFFYDLNAIKSGKSRPAVSGRWKPAKVGIVGAGMMGAGIAYANAARGIGCVLVDTTLERAEAGRGYSRKLTDAQVAKGRMSAAEQARLVDSIAPAGSIDALAGCDLVIEAVYEKRALKAEVTRAAEAVMAAGGVFASNTSTLPITGLAEASRAPERFVGLHFFSPVDKMKLVEIIRGAATSDETVARAYDYVLALGKTPIVVGDGRGFFTSRVFGTYVMEGAAMLAEGLPAAVVEQAALQAGMPVGPLAVLDETSLALSVQVLEQTRADLAAQGRSYTAGPGELLVERMVKEFGRAGRAAGGGFYDYPPGGAPKRLWPGLKTHFERAGAQWDLQQLKDRLLYRQSVETLRCLAEGILTSAHEANIGSIFGIGFPAWTGGAAQFVRSEGVERFIARAGELAERCGARFALDDRALQAARALR
jgi:3-hydroxyacyl-CoA dehydrogenase/enoyl-CoA hydratase/3-hydroxybutyryl-CoA epimerase